MGQKERKKRRRLDAICFGFWMFDCSNGFSKCFKQTTDRLVATKLIIYPILFFSAMNAVLYCKLHAYESIKFAKVNTEHGKLLFNARIVLSAVCTIQ